MAVASRSMMPKKSQSKPPTSSRKAPHRVMDRPGTRARGCARRRASGRRESRPRNRRHAATPPTGVAVNHSPGKSAGHTDNGNGCGSCRAQCTYSAISRLRLWYRILISIVLYKFGRRIHGQDAGTVTEGSSKVDKATNSRDPEHIIAPGQGTRARQDQSAP